MQSSVCQGQPSPLLLHAEHCVDSEDKQRFKEVYDTPAELETLDKSPGRVK